ncbi:ThiF family adenylyltransferase [Shinella sp. DD12]|uniref:ThiF family adenylyltransferase n=1 Tax=Shinella sp. DD12 TaxID=1410620 RepID=UPI0003C535C3|nr:ThiF family adenylyltransferase [Shinella sp. DD12]EYR82659.1 dinucleotide-utilizing enzyme involved in molybdopterin and thiamine biosynthesis family 2 [Shinella sp. DD12]
MSIWWANNTVRVAREKEAVENLAAENDWFVFDRWEIHDYKFAAVGSIVAHGATYPVRLVYPDNFPLVPAWVQPQDPEARWSDHQYGKGGALCLELRPDNWTSRASGADVLRSAYGLLNLENPLGEGEKGKVKSAHHVGEIQRYNWGESPVFIGRAFLDRLFSGTINDVQALRWAASDKVWPIYLSDAVDRAGVQRPPAFDMDTWRFPVAVVLVSGQTPANLPLDRNGFISAIWESPPVDGEAAFVAVFIENDGINVFHVLSDEAYHRKVYILPPETGLRSGRAPSAQGKKVAIVGAGSVGSKVAEMLVRSGIDSMRIFDGDVFLPGNLERHVLDWRDVGYHKVHGLKRRLQHIVPGANITTVDENLNWQKSARTNAAQFDLVTGCDIIVDASGDPATSMLLGALAFENQKPFVSVEVFEGGIGALVAPSVPDRNAAYTLGREALLNWTDERGRVPLSTGGRDYEAIGNYGEIIVADDAAISMAASHAARVVLDILDDKLEDVRWLMIGFRKEWAFDMHGHVIALDVGGPSAWNNNTEDAEALKFVIELAGELMDALKAFTK